VITGDDILIEYVRRTMGLVRQLGPELPPSLVKKLEAFLGHKVWFSRGGQHRQAD
jgi:hypothetical protein